MASYGWTKLLEEEVPDGGTVEIHAPGISNPDCVIDKAQLAVHNVTMEAEKFSVSQAEDVATVTNSTGEPWPATASVYLYAPSKLGSGEGLTAIIDTLEAHDARIAALEGKAPAATKNAKNGKK